MNLRLTSTCWTDSKIDEERVGVIPAHARLTVPMLDEEATAAVVDDCQLRRRTAEPNFGSKASPLYTEVFHAYSPRGAIMIFFSYA